MIDLPCACGDSDTEPVGVCARCQRTMIMSEVHAAFAKVAKVASNVERVSRICDAIDDETAKGKVNQ